MSIHRILVVDDDSLSRDFLVEATRELGYHASSAAGASQALELLAKESFDLVLSDLRMPGTDGLELVRTLHREWPDVAAIVITAHGTVESAVQAMREGASDFLLKPCTAEALEIVLSRIGHTKRLERENRYLREAVIGSEPASMVAESQTILDLLRSAARIARSKGTVLLTGESGTGKERIAHYIHRHSPRADGPFIRVNCAALTETLLESELFGHERGSFTGAHRMRPGRFELADRGTILLDEIAEITPNMQAKLLRVLQEEEFERVGGQTTLKVDVRVIAATNKDLAKEVAEGRFREDLYYRLHVLPLELPPLRARTEDILPLAEHFAAHYARENGAPAPRFDDEARRRLMAWSWPGNVRELENVVQRAVILAHEGEIGPEELLFGPSSSAPASILPSRAASSLSLQDPDFGRALANNAMADIERVAILATLESTRGNKTEAARRLGLTARTLSNKMKIWRQAGLVV
jgi:DNA-binding NtrC family response regulator